MLIWLEVYSQAITASLDPEEMKQIKDSLNKKISKDELQKMKSALEKELNNIVQQVGGFYPPDGTAVRVHYRCLSCDRILWRVTTPNTAPGTNFQLGKEGPDGTAGKKSTDIWKLSLADIPIRSLAPNIAWRRSQVKEVLKAQQVEELQKLQDSASWPKPSSPNRGKRSSLQPLSPTGKAVLVTAYILEVP